MFDGVGSGYVPGAWLMVVGFWQERVVGIGRKITDCAVLAELSLTVPIVNTLAFLFTVVGEWWVEGKVISRGKSWLLFCPEV